MFSAAVKYAKEQRLQYVKQHDVADRTEGQDIYHAAIKKFMLAIKSINQNEVNFEIPWAGLTARQVNAEMIRLALSIVSGEYDKKQSVVIEAKRKAAAKRAPGKPEKKKAVRKK